MEENLNQEQVVETPIQDQVEKPTDQVEVPEEPQWSITQEDYNKNIQSAKSTAKFEIMKELGISSVKEFKTQYDATLKTNDTLKNEIESLRSQIENLTAENMVYKDREKTQKENEFFGKFDVDEKYLEDFKTLVKTKASDESEYDKVATSILEKNSNWLKGGDLNIGTDKSEKEETRIPESLKKYPWIK